jgi:hypothetical protein
MWVQIALNLSLQMIYYKNNETWFDLIIIS